jgi:release factor glutamine methyltransferase
MPTTTVVEAIRAAAAQLKEVSDTARLDAELLMAHALGSSRSHMLLYHMRIAAPEGFAALVERRLAHEPLAYITGTAQFYGVDLAVSPDVLIPRSDSETVIDAARTRFSAGTAPARICDLGTGSGALLLAALSVWPHAQGVGIDRSERALANAQANANANELTPRSCFYPLDWSEHNWTDKLGQFDLVLSNPPYVESDAELERQVHRFEPHEALFAGPQGLDDYQILVPQLGALLSERGVAVLEIGMSQAADVSAIARDAGFGADLHRDLSGNPRALVLERS